MELDVQRCPHCKRVLSGPACPTCAAGAAQGATTAASATSPPIASGPTGVEPSSPRHHRRAEERSAWWLRGAALSAFALVIAFGWSRCADRPSWRGLATQVDGPKPSAASTILFFLHGYGGSNDDVDWLEAPLRTGGVPADTAIVFIEGPFVTGLGRHWGDDGAARLGARERAREAIRDAIGASSIPPERVFIAGFSQGAQLAADIAAAEPRIGGLALLSACAVDDREPFREGMKIVVAHGKSDSVCSFGVSRALVERLDKQEGLEVTFVPFDGNHFIPPVAIEALAKLVGGGS